MAGETPATAATLDGLLRGLFFRSTLNAERSTPIGLFAALGEGVSEPWAREDPYPEVQRPWDHPQD